MARFPKLTYLLSAKLLYWSNELCLYCKLQPEVLGVGIRLPMLMLGACIFSGESEEDKEEEGNGPFEREIYCYWHKNKRNISVRQWAGNWVLMALQCIPILPRVTGHSTDQPRIMSYDLEVSLSKVKMPPHHSVRFIAKVIFVCDCFWELKA